VVGVLASLVLAGVAVATARAFRGAAARGRVLAVFFALCAAVGPLAWLAAQVRPPAPARAGGLHPVAETLLPVLGAGALIALVLLLELALDVVRLRRIKLRAVQVGATGVRGAIIGVSSRVGTPTAIGYVHPAIVVPDGFRRRVDETEWKAVLQHECAHLRRYDDWTKAIQSVVQRVGWWLPGLWILGRALDLERELASDEDAAAATGARRYAACLLRLATTPAVDSAALALWGRRTHVAIRVERLLRPAAGWGLLGRGFGAAAAATATLAVLALASVAVPSSRTAVPPPAPARVAWRVPLAPSRHPTHRRPRTVGPHAAAAPAVAILHRAAPRIARIVLRPAISAPDRLHVRPAVPAQVAYAATRPVHPHPRAHPRIVRDPDPAAPPSAPQPAASGVVLDENEAGTAPAPRTGAVMIRLPHPPSP
jgi:beta-lactamase regulating signal transducer with metallopeptidase domain